MYTKILVPHSGIVAGDETLRHAIQFVKGTSSKVIVSHVIEKAMTPGSISLSSSESEELEKLLDQPNNEIKKYMEEEIEKKIQIYKEDKVESEIRVVIGYTNKVILDIVEKERIDLIVMAKRRKMKGLQKLLSLGSVSQKIIENVKCPVTLVDIEDL